MGMSARDKSVVERIMDDFTYHAPKGNQPGQYEEIRTAGKKFALLVAQLCPNSREQSLALTKIEEAVMWANAGVARHGNPSE
jgi:hypothetical protein